MTLENADDRLVWLLRTSRNLFATRDVERFIPVATDAFIELTGADRGYLFLTERDTGKISPCAARGPGGLQLTAPDARIVGLVNQVFKERTPIVAT
ncbi:MAG TPA: hypothetical protein VFH51_01160, partial [Myxococcota bacterium]|nr:hypothetical protein [Myxococcota bacterium]